MNAKQMTALLIAGCVIMESGLAQTPDVAHFCGQLTWPNSNTNLYYSIEWASALTVSDVWHSSYTTLTDIRSPNPTVTSSVPMFYRVCGSSNRVVYPSLVARTGQTPAAPLNPAPAGSDGALQKGVPWPSPRFTDTGKGSVIDNLTGLTWLKNGNPCGMKTWTDALSYCNSLSNGIAGLSDGSVAGDWRLPNIREIQTLLDYSQNNPALPSGHPFTGVQTPDYWSSSPISDWAEGAWSLTMASGCVRGGEKSIAFYVWPVRAGQ